MIQIHPLPAQTIPAACPKVLMITLIQKLCSETSRTTVIRLLKDIVIWNANHAHLDPSKQKGWRSSCILKVCYLSNLYNPTLLLQFKSPAGCEGSRSSWTAEMVGRMLPDHPITIFFLEDSQRLKGHDTQKKKISILVYIWQFLPRIHLPVFIQDFSAGSTQSRVAVSPTFPEPARLPRPTSPLPEQYQGTDSNPQQPGTSQGNRVGRIAKLGKKYFCFAS